MARNHATKTGFRHLGIYRELALGKSRLKIGHCRYRPRHHLRKFERLSEIVKLCSSHKLNRIRLIFTSPRHLRRLRQGTMWFKTMQRFSIVRTGDIIDTGMMNLGNQSIRTARQTFNRVKSFDNRKFPGSLGHVERSGVQPGDLNTQLTPVTRFWQPYMADMKFKIKVLILNPIGVIQIKRYFYQLSSKGFC